MWNHLCRSAAELDSPKLIDHNVLAVRVPDRPHELSGYAIEGVDGAAVGVIRDQQSVAEGPKILGRNGETPRLVQRLRLAPVASANTPPSL